MNFIRKLPIPQEIKKEYPLKKEREEIRDKKQGELKNIFAGRSGKFALIIGPCSADREDAVLDYISRLAEVQEKVDKLSSENSEYTAVLTSTDRSDYYEKIAREVYGYGKPGEFVFYKAES